MQFNSLQRNLEIANKVVSKIKENFSFIKSINMDTGEIIFFSGENGENIARELFDTETLKGKFATASIFTEIYDQPKQDIRLIFNSKWLKLSNSIPMNVDDIVEAYILVYNELNELSKDTLWG